MIDEGDDAIAIDDMLLVRKAEKVSALAIHVAFVGFFYRDARSGIFPNSGTLFNGGGGIASSVVNLRRAKNQAHGIL
jgi:hypothetical protein